MCVCSSCVPAKEWACVISTCGKPNLSLQAWLTLPLYRLVLPIPIQQSPSLFLSFSLFRKATCFSYMFQITAWSPLKMGETIHRVAILVNHHWKPLSLTNLSRQMWRTQHFLAWRTDAGADCFSTDRTHLDLTLLAHSAALFFVTLKKKGNLLNNDYKSKYKEHNKLCSSESIILSVGLFI